jgi:hypothetical protein
MKSQTRSILLHAAALLALLFLCPIPSRCQTSAGADLDSAEVPSTANWTVTKHGKHLMIRLNSDANLSMYNKIMVGTVSYTGPVKKLRSQESQKLATLLRDSLTKALSAAKLSPGSSATKSLTLNAQITDVKRVHPWVNVVTMAAVFAPLDFGGANVTAWLIDQQKGQIVAQIETVGCGQIYEAFPSLQSLGQAKLALKKDSRAIAKGFASVDWNRRPLNVNAADVSWNK